MSESCLVRVQWRGDRKESPEECARRALRLFEELARIDSVFRQFDKTIRKRGKYVRVPVPLQVDGLAELFTKGVNRRDVDRSVISELGYSLGVSTHGRGHAWLTIYCGVHDSPANANGCFLSLDLHRDDDARIVSVAGLIRILRAMVDAFEPQVGSAGFSSYREAVVPDKQLGIKELDLDWILYFSREWGRVPPIPTPVRIEPVGDQGTLVILTPERISAANPEHVELGRQVRMRLNKAHLLDNRLTD